MSADETASFEPRYDANGLIAVVVEDARTAETLMFAHANAEAVRLTLETGVGHFWSRSRRELWRKGATSGNELAIEDIRVDCDQDVLLYRVRVGGNGIACHTGRRTCFYRSLVSDGSSLTFVGEGSE